MHLAGSSNIKCRLFNKEYLQQTEGKNKLLNKEPLSNKHNKIAFSCRLLFFNFLCKKQHAGGSNIKYRPVIE